MTSSLQCHWTTLWSDQLCTNGSNERITEKDLPSNRQRQRQRQWCEILCNGIETKSTTDDIWSLKICFALVFPLLFLYTCRWGGLPWIDSWICPAGMSNVMMTKEHICLLRSFHIRCEAKKTYEERNGGSERERGKERTKKKNTKKVSFSSMLYAGPRSAEKFVNSLSLSLATPSFSL